jgi:hypothetical protein
MLEEVDDSTAAQVGHALLRWVLNDDPASLTRFVPDLDPTTVDDARAARIGHALVDLLQQLKVA